MFYGQSKNVCGTQLVSQTFVEWVFYMHITRELCDDNFSRQENLHRGLGENAHMTNTGLAVIEERRETPEGVTPIERKDLDKDDGGLA